MLDPGHGGTNLGASAEGGAVHEKRLTLRLARLTARELRRREPALRVLLTRYRDHYVSLQARVDRANLAGADVFVSIHLNACESHGRRGFEIYVLNAAASEDEALRAGQSERTRAGDKGAASPAQVIFAELKQQASHERSRLLAWSVQQALRRGRAPADDGGVREGPFDVLVGLNMPGVLVELGFIDHPVEGEELQRPDVQRRLATNLAKGIVAFVRGRASRGPSTAPQAQRSSSSSSESSQLLDQTPVP